MGRGGGGGLFRIFTIGNPGYLSCAVTVVRLKIFGYDDGSSVKQLLSGYRNIESKLSLLTLIYLSFRNRSQGEALGTIPCRVHEQFLFHFVGGTGRWCSPCVIVRTNNTIALFF